MNIYILSVVIDGETFLYLVLCDIQISYIKIYS